MKKIILISIITGVAFAKLCQVTFWVKKSNPHFPYLFYKEKFICQNWNKGWKYQEALGCRKRSIWYKHTRYFLYICPASVEIIGN